VVLDVISNIIASDSDKDGMLSERLWNMAEWMAGWRIPQRPERSNWTSAGGEENQLAVSLG
jgi:hypothetical protein